MKPEGPRRTMKTPRVVHILITNSCNLRCAYCYHFTGSSDVDHDLPLREWLTFFEELRQCKVMEVTFHGGEPFFRPDITGIIEGVVQNNMRFRVTSNGTLITEGLAEYIAQTGRCNEIKLSIDGSSPSMHDPFRGEGSFEKAVRGIEILLRRNIPVTASVTVHKRNVHHLGEIAEFLLEKLAVDKMLVNNVSPFGLCRFQTDDILLDHDERLAAMKAKKELRRKYKDQVCNNFGSTVDRESWEYIENGFRSGREPLEHEGKLWVCETLLNSVTVRPDGMIVPCSGLSHLELGLINSHAVSDIWLNHPELIRLRDRDKIAMHTFEFCRDCSYAAYCTGGCPANSYRSFGDAYHPSYDDCLKRYIEAGGTLPEPAEQLYQF